MNKNHISFILGISTAVAASAADNPKPNILFIAVDDLRDELNCYGATHMHTPNIDRLARQGVLFQKAYCQQAVCAPSRNSIMTGLRPDAMGIYDLSTFFRTKVPDVVTMSEYFKHNGYRAEATGKIYHTGHGNMNDEQSWSVPHRHPGREMALESITRGDTTHLESDFPRINGARLPYYASDASEENMTDAVIARIAVERINALKDSTFFLAVGFVKPHLPFVAPKKYWDLYDRSEIKIPKRIPPEGMYEYALNEYRAGEHFRVSGELIKYYGIPETGFLDDELSLNLIHGYYAAVSMIDAQVGKILDALDENGLTENTIIVLWGDHGFKIGEYGTWCKHTNFELDTNVPLIISAPGMNNGTTTGSLAELVDIYPTLCDLAGLEKPEHLEGQSLLPVLMDPEAVVNKVAISQYPSGRGLGYDNKREIMGYSIRTDNFRYTRWQKYENPAEIVGVELYDHSEGKVSTVNLAGIATYESDLERLSELLTFELSKYKILQSSPTDKMVSE